MSRADDRRRGAGRSCWGPARLERTGSGPRSSPSGLTLPSRLSSPRARYSTVHLVFDIFQGIGGATAVGNSLFQTPVAVGALGAADVQIDFSHPSYSFLEQAPFLLVMVIGVA